MAEESRSTFDFSDQFGSDPITRRYRPTNLVDIRGAEAGAREAAATRELAEANLAKVQAELTAQMAPMKMGVEMVTTMSELVKNRAAMQEKSAISMAAATISEALGNPNLDLKGLSQLASGSNAIGLQDTETGVRVRSLMLDKFRQAVDNAESPYEVDTIFSSIPSTLAAEPPFVTARANALSQANLRQGVQQSFASEPSLGKVPVTPAGGVDVPGAQISIAAKAGDLERRKEAGANLKFVRDQIESLERKAATADLTPSELLERETLEADARRLLGIVMQRDVSEGSQPTDSAAPPGDRVGNILPQSAVTAPDQAAAASAAATATGGATTTPETSASAPVPTALPLTLAEEARQAVEQAQQAEIRASTAPAREERQVEAERKIEEGTRLINLRNLVKEKSSLLKAIYENEAGQKLKPGITSDSDIVKRVLARIAEIDKELPKK